MIRIPLSYNSIDSLALNSVLERYHDKHHSHLIGDFESAIASAVGSRFAVAVNSGTAAIHLALLVSDVKPGDWVFAPTFTYVATVNPILYVGARPVLLDVEKDTWNIDPNLLETVLKEFDKKGTLPSAMVVVHTYGTPARIEAILELAKKYGITVIEDAAESLGATVGVKQTGTFGAVGAFSFNNNKSVTGFGGGVLVTDSPALASRARFLAAQAREDFPYYQHRTVGFNYSINPLAAAYCLSQLPSVKLFNDNRRQVFDRYKSLLPDTFTAQRDYPGVSSSRWLSTFLLPEGAEALGIIEQMRAAGIETRPLWKPMHLQPLFEHCPAYLNGNSESFFKAGICLPSGNNLTEASQLEVIGCIKELV